MKDTQNNKSILYDNDHHSIEKLNFNVLNKVVIFMFVLKKIFKKIFVI
ncbi:hypothetical protein M153_6500074 [Pseudoloma neurophilia]|uniref:Uncharacterized protein n=1 Tax=Pseudoloma neurophilia TaxID=146866 RepID=A0A0R0M0L2_9MICR|nr:hypothetical protein M153_6500074 [Pseudoloma neurophilia]